MEWNALATVSAPVITVALGWLGLRKPRKEIKDLHSKVGNGFANEVTQTLGQVAGSVDTLKVQMGVVTNRLNEHVNMHAAGVYGKSKPR